MSIFICDQLNCLRSVETISLSGNAFANCIILRKFFSEKLLPYSFDNCRHSVATIFFPYISSEYFSVSSFTLLPIFQYSIVISELTVTATLLLLVSMRFFISKNKGSCYGIILIVFYNYSFIDSFFRTLKIQF